MPKTSAIRLISLLLLLSAQLLHPTPPALQVPVTGDAQGNTEETAAITVNIPDLASFSLQVRNGMADMVTGIYIRDRLALSVVQQPAQEPGYVSSQDEVVTQFSMASQFDSLGFLAHNYLAGAYFFLIEEQDVIYVIHGDGGMDRYSVTEIRRLQALQPNNVYSDFVDLQSGENLSVTQMFYQTYGVSDQVILQTCISAEGQDSWGRLFIIATPYVPLLSKLIFLSSRIDF